MAGTEPQPDWIDSRLPFASALSMSQGTPQETPLRGQLQIARVQPGHATLEFPQVALVHEDIVRLREAGLPIHLSRQQPFDAGRRFPIADHEAAALNLL